MKFIIFMVHPHLSGKQIVQEYTQGWSPRTCEILPAHLPVWIPPPNTMPGHTWRQLMALVLCCRGLCSLPSLPGHEDGVQKRFCLESTAEQVFQRGERVEIAWKKAVNLTTVFTTEMAKMGADDNLEITTFFCLIWIMSVPCLPIFVEKFIIGKRVF